MKIGVFLRPFMPASDVARLARLAEDAGCDFVGVADGQMIWRDVYVCLTAAAMVTERVQLGPWVTQPVTRHLTVTAGAICSLDELSEGRAILGLGNGDDAVKTIGRPRATLAEAEVAVRQIRSLAAGETIERESGPLWSLAAARPTSPPIYWAGSGPNSLRFAGRVADGVIHSGWLLPDLAAADLDFVAEGARESGRSLDDLDLIFNTALSIDDDSQVAVGTAKPYAARALIYGSSVRVPGWSEEQRNELEREYNYYSHMAEGNPANDLVPNQLVTTKAVAGEPDAVIKAINTVAGFGYTHIAFTPMGDPETVIERLGRQVVPRLGF